MNSTALTDKTFHRAVTVLGRQDPDLANIVSRWGRPPFWRHASGFSGLVAAILAQQVSLESARSVLNKLMQAIGPVNPEGFLALDDAALRAMGFSRQKAMYVRGLAHAIQTGEIDPDALAYLTNADVRKRLMEIKGIGTWTADTYLLFSLRRPDAWPSGDLALAKAIQEVRGLARKPDWEEVDSIAGDWRPWRAVAARILWHHYLCERGRTVPL